jgi:ribosomal protein L40E
MSQAKFDSAQDDELCYCSKCDATSSDDTNCNECGSTKLMTLDVAVDLELIEVSTVDDGPVYGDEDEEDDYDGGSFL